MSNFRMVDDLLNEFIQAKNGPVGCACGIAKDGEIIYERYLGYADREAGRSVAEDSLFDIWSITKLVTVTAAMILYGRGKFLLNDPIYDYFPEYKDMDIVVPESVCGWKTEKAKRPILVKDAFTMACGMPYAMGDITHPSVLAAHNIRKELREKYDKYDLRTEIRAMAKAPLAFEPGTHWVYGYGHELVAGLVEVCSGMSLGAFMKKEIFDPLGLKDIGYRFDGDQRDRMCRMYSPAPDGTKSLMKNSGFSFNHEPDSILEAGGGGLFSSLKDYLTFTHMLACGGRFNDVKIIGRKTIDLIRRNQLDDTQLADFYRNAQNSVYMPGYGYGLGVRTMIDPAKGDSNTSLGEFGWTGGSGTWACIDPEERLSIVYMHQMWPNMEAYFHPRVRAAVYNCLD